MLVAALCLVVFRAQDLRQMLMLGLPLVVATFAVHSFAPRRLDLWLSAGWLTFADATLIGLILFGVPGVPPAAIAGFFIVVAAAVLLAESTRTILVSAAILMALLAIASMAGLTTPGWPLVDLLFIPGLAMAAVGFSSIAACMTGHEQAIRSARHETDELWALLRIHDAIGSSLDASQVMRQIVKQVGDLVQTDSCSILVTDEKLRKASVVASKGHPDVDMLELDLQNYPEILHALETREPVVVDDVETHPLVESVRDVLLAKGYRSLLVLPLVFGREILGTLFLRGRGERPFTQEELHFCRVAAGASANALKNALLFEEVKEQGQRHADTSEKLRRVLDGTPDMIVAADEVGRVTEFNRGAERLTGKVVEAVLFRPLADVFGGEANLFESSNSESEGAPRDVTLKRPDGETVQLSLVSAALTDAAGEPVGTVWIGRDVTRLRRVENSLVQSERLSSLGEVVAGVAHELNNPLTSVIGYGRFAHNASADSDQRQDLERMVDSAERCKKIVQNLLSFSRQHNAEKQNGDLNECVEKVIEIKSYHLRSSQINFKLELDRSIPRTRFDFHQLEQVVLNMINNAEHAVAGIKQDGGRIVIETGVVGDEIFVAIDDNGYGVPDAVRDRIFDPFFTTKDVGQGTGLGLSVSFGIVQEHGGRIDLEWEGRSGSRFVVYLPIVAATATDESEEGTSPMASEKSLAGVHVLLAEDDEDVREVFSRMLEEDGAQVTSARDGEEAWSHIQDKEDKYDLIVADLRMPGMSGKELYERVGEEYPQLIRRFVFATGDLARDETTAFLEGLPNGILHKPLEAETVRRVLGQVVAAV